MKKIFFSIFVLLIATFSCFAQNLGYSVSTLSKELKENANACIRLNDVSIVISSQNSMTTKRTRVVTVFNEYGMRHIQAGETEKVRSIEAIIYNSFGKEIKKIKRRDFKEESLSEGLSISDNKLLYLNYTPTEYPFTIAYTSETETPNTAFIGKWFAIDNNFVSVEKNTVSVSYFPSSLGFKYREVNFGEYPIEKKETQNSISYSVSNVSALRNEQYSPSFSKMVPHVLFGIDNFYLEGVSGVAKNWEEFGKWMSVNLLAGTDVLSEDTKSKIKTLVGNEKDPIKVAKIVYQYVQSKTRYISIQLGIGGWKPMLAKDVDRLGYGDCKALTNYTRALLEVVGVPSYYTIINADSEKININSDFVSMQGNHVILGIPVGNEIKWLECTSQISPFGFQGKSTDDRNALIITSEGGKIVKTHNYLSDENTQFLKAKYNLLADGSITGDITIKSKGIQYANKFSLERNSSVDLEKNYKEYFSNINNLKMSKIAFENNKDEIEFSENIVLEANQYANLTGGKLMFAINAFNQYSSIPQRYKVRVNPFEIERGFYDEDEIIVKLPDGFKIEAGPQNFELKEKFGHYKTEYKIVDEKYIHYKRTLLINDGQHASSEYENYRKFREQIAKNDNAKYVLLKS